MTKILARLKRFFLLFVFWRKPDTVAEPAQPVEPVSAHESTAILGVTGESKGARPTTVVDTVGTAPTNSGEAHVESQRLPEGPHQWQQTTAPEAAHDEATPAATIADAPEAASHASAPAPETIIPLLAMDIVPPVETAERYAEPRAKWVKPKGLDLIKRAERAESAEPKPKAPPRPKRPRPQLRPDENPERWGQYYFRDAILDQLDRYFVYLKRMRQHDKDAYELHRRIGIQVMPGSAVQAFDNWRSEEGMDDLSAWWKENRPGFGAISYGIDFDSMDEERNLIVDLPPEAMPKERPDWKAKHRILTISGGNDFRDEYTGTMVKPGILWVPKFLYFHKYRKPPPEIQRVVDGDVYSMTVYWDRVDHRSKRFDKRHKGGIPQDYAICVERATGAVRVLRMLINERVHIRHKHGPDKGLMFSIPNKHWGIATEYLSWACGRGDASPEDFLRRCFIEAALMYEHGAMGSMIRIEATKGGRAKDGGMVATFGVDVKRMSYFFKDRDITAATLTERGTRRPIFHIVRPHMRRTKKGETAVHMHFSGLREFDWAKYHIKITVPVLDHLALPELPIGSDHAEKGERRPKGALGMAEYGDCIVEHLNKGDGAWTRSERKR